MNQTSSSLVLLDDIVVIEISGADAGAFLHGQLTHDIASLEADSARLAGYCTAKGRLLGTLVVWLAQPAPEPVFHALVKADIAQAIVKRLSMFVLRAKVVLRIVPLDVLGISIATTPSASATTPQLALPDNISTVNRAKGSLLDTSLIPAQAAPFAVVHVAPGTWIAAPTASPGLRRWWCVVGTSDAQTGISQTRNAQVANNEVAGGPDAGQASWQAADIEAGLPWIIVATQDVFIPQTLNLDLIDGISFTKGCYPGQEVVARSHYRGTVKRRMAYGLIRQSIVQNVTELPNLDIFDAHRPASPCGRVINAAATGITHLLLEVQLADLGHADFRLGQADGPSIEIAPLPYEIKTVE